MTYNATDEELVKYGLDEPQYNLEVKYTPKSEDSSEAVSYTHLLAPVLYIQAPGLL